MRPTTALVTGAGSGIGRAVARRLAADGARVALLGRTLAKLEETAAAIAAEGGAAPIVIEACHERESDVDAAFARIDAALGPSGSLDVLINNAAVYGPGTACDAALSDWRASIEINLLGPLLMTRAFVARARRRGGGGVIVNVASTLGLRPVAGFTPYAVSKAALLHLTRCVALEEAAHGVRALAVCPGVVDTPIHDRDGGGAAFLQQAARLHPLGRVGTADEVAALIAHLAGPTATWMTGSVVTIDGGISI